MKTRMRNVVLGAILAAFSTIQYAEADWITIDAPGAYGTEAYGIDGSNIVGQYYGASGYHGFLFDGMNWVDIDFPDAYLTTPIDIDAGRIVGTYNGWTEARGFQFDGTTWETIAFPGAHSTVVESCDGNYIVGYYGAPQAYHGFLYDGVNWTTLDAPGASETFACDIDISRGTIVGSTNGPTYGWLYCIDTKTFTPLYGPGGVTVLPRAIGGSRIGGYYHDGVGTQHGFLYDGTTWTVLDFPGASQTVPRDIEGSRIVGPYYVGSRSHGFLYTLDQPPVADAGPDQTLEASSHQGALVTLDGSGSSDPDSSPGTNNDIVSFEWYIDDILIDIGETISAYFSSLDSYPVTLVVTDTAEQTDEDEVVITVVDTTPPVITLIGEETMALECGIDVYQERGATALDIYDPTVSVIIDGDTVDTSTCGTYIVTYDATDASGNAAVQVTRTVTVEDTLPPVIIAAEVEPQVVEVNQPVNFDAFVSDECGFTVEWDFGDNNPASTNNPTTHPYDSADIYTVTLTATDTSGNTALEEFFVVVYDISGGFVTGGGWIWSLPDSYKPDPMLEGKANFGFVSKYKKGATIPTGNTEFIFQAGDLNFHSMSYDWLVVNQNDSNAQFKGSGTINGEGDYKFMLWAGDKEPDEFRIKIWSENLLGDETIVYDNGFNQPIGGGSIVIHTR